MKRIKALVLCAAILLLCSLLPKQTQAATYGDMTYEVVGGEVTITGYTTKPTGALVIPDEIGGYPVTEISYGAFLSCFDITEVTIGNNVKVIGASAFDHCTSLSKLTMGNKVEVIGDYAFNYCSKLSTVTMGDSVKTIGEYAFQACMVLAEPKIGNNVTSIGDSAFTQCHGLKNVYIPASVTFIGDEAFHYTVGLQGIWVSEDNAVYSSDDRGVLFDKEKTTLIQAPGGLSGSYTVPDGVVTIEGWSFFSCGNLTHVTIPDTVEYIKDSAFYSSGLQTVTLGDGLIAIDSAFKDCSNLQYNTFDNGKYLGTADNPYYALVGCSSTSITSVVIHSQTKIICDAFALCSDLTSVTMANGVISIGSRAFFSCSALAQITVPNSVRYIGERAFSSCEKLEALSIPQGVTAIGKYAFYGCKALTRLDIPESVTEIGANALSYCTGLTGVWVAESNASYCSDENGVLYDKNKTVLIKAPAALSGTYTIPASVTSIEVQAFHNCTGLSGISIPQSVTQIGESAFYNCTGLTGISIPNGVTSIGGSLLRGCTALVSVDLPDSATYIGSLAFYGCSALKSVIIPNGVEKLLNQTFQDCTSLETIGIPDSMTSISTSAFRNGGTALKTVMYCGTEEQWNKITGVSDITCLVDAEKSWHDFGAATTTKTCTYCGTKWGVYGDSVTWVLTPDGTLTFSGTGAMKDSNKYGYAGIPWYNKTVKKVIIEDGITTIGAYAFYNCSELTQISVPDSVVSIGQYAFYCCSEMEQMNFSKNLSSIGEMAFYRCYKLTELVFPDNLTYIGVRAFENCTGLDSVTFGTGLVQIDQDAFCYCEALTQVHIKDLDAWCKVQFGRTDSYGYGYKTNPLDYTPNLYLNGELVRSLALTENVSANAFRNCTNIVSVTIPQSVTSIGENAFYNCTNLTHVLHIGSRESYAGIVADTGLPGVYTWCRDAVGNEIYTRNACVTKEHVCSICEKTLWTEPREDGSHSWTAATCTTPKTCSVCGATEGEAAGHSGELWFELSTPTCTQTGIKARICDVCGTTETVTLEALGHSYSSVVTAPTCTEGGYTTHTCSACGDTVTDTPVAALGHSYGQWEQSKAPTCEEVGQESSVCGVCGETQTRDVAALGHSNSSVVTEPTCTEEGYTTNTCSVCGTVTVTDIVAAKGHSWSAWIQTAAPSCTKEGARVRFCNCGVRETEVLPKTHTTQNGICTACGELESYNWVLTADADVKLTLTQDLYVDLAGFDLTGTVVTNGFKIYGMDTSTDGYTCDAMGSFSCLDESGETVVPESHFKNSDTLKRYMAIFADGSYSFHRFYLGITHMSLKPTTTGVGYKAVFYGDEMVAANLESFGFTMCLDGNDPVAVSKAGESFVSGKVITLRVDNFDVERHGETKLYASVMLKLKDGTVIESVRCEMTMRGLMEQLNTNYTALSAQQLTAVADMIKKYAIMTTWKVENLIAE